jgi:hypothetical protein
MDGSIQFYGPYKAGTVWHPNQVAAGGDTILDTNSL